MGWFDIFKGEGFGAAVSDVNDQEALGQSIVDQAIYDQSVLDLANANEHAALAFEGEYQHATAGPAYDPTVEDPYGFQQILGRAIVQQSQGTPPYIQDDTPLSLVNGADLGAWAKAAMGAAKSFAPSNPGGVGTVKQPKQIFSNRPGQGSGFIITPSRNGGAVNQAGSSAPNFVVLGLVALGVYLALR